ncbi:MAG: hypothetical protein WDO71_23765 [Bacteroidota bacterium]
MQIKQALGIAGVYTEASGWRYIPKKGETGVQIDLLVDRQDHCNNLCEMKFAADEFVINKNMQVNLTLRSKFSKNKQKRRKQSFPP